MPFLSDPKASPLYALVEDYFDPFQSGYEERFAERHGFWRPIVRKVADRFIDCVNLCHRFARIRSLIICALILGIMDSQGATPSLPGQYFRLLEAGADMVRQRLDAEPGADLAALEARPGWEL